MTIFQILIVAVIQGACEMLPVSSSAHVIMAEKLMGIDPTTPEMTFLLVMLHTGTMFAVIIYFWSAWRRSYFSSRSAFWRLAQLVTLATGLTGVVGLSLLLFIEKVLLRGSAHAEIEHLFGNPYVIAAGLAAAGVMIVVSGRREAISRGEGRLRTDAAVWIGVVQGLCLPFRGFSRSGSTISTGLLLRVDKARVEEFSFALAVVLTPAVIAKEGYRLLRAHEGSLTNAVNLFHFALPSMLGMIFSFLAGLAALHWLSRWLERGRWQWFGYYCLFAAVVVLAIGAP